MLHVGLTGGIASGKSHAARVFAELGAHVIDGDKLAHDLMAPGRAAYDEIVAYFGPEILNADGTIQRKVLADIVFHDQEALRKLNAIVHPKVMEEEARLVSEYAEINPLGVVIIDAALLVESRAYTILDKLIVVYCDPKVQLSRLMARDNLSLEEAEARIAAQMPMEEKLKVADYRIDTSETFKETRAQIEQIYKELVALALLKG
jgi:dephospho-CoA kinase